MYKGLPMTERQFHGLDVFEGDLILENVDIPEKFNADILGNLYIWSEASISDDFTSVRSWSYI